MLATRQFIKGSSLTASRAVGLIKDVYIKGSKNNYIMSKCGRHGYCGQDDRIDWCRRGRPEIAFKMKELGPVKLILGMEIDHKFTVGMFMVKQTRYIDNVSERFGQENPKPLDMRAPQDLDC